MIRVSLSLTSQTQGVCIDWWRAKILVLEYKFTIDNGVRFQIVSCDVHKSHIVKRNYKRYPLILSCFLQGVLVYIYQVYDTIYFLINLVLLLLELYLILNYELQCVS